MSFVKFKSWLAGLVTVALVGCGGGGSGGTPFVGGDNPAGVAAVQVTFSAASVSNSGTATNVATVTVLDGNGRGMSGVAVNIGVDKNAAYTTGSTGAITTGTDGTVKATVSIGSDTTLRTITLTASAGTVSGRASFAVVDSRTTASDLSLIGANILQNSLNNSLTLTATAVDANRNALSGIALAFSIDRRSDGSLESATLTPASTITDSSGSIAVTLKIGSDQSNRDIVVRAASGTQTITKTVTVIGAKLTASGVVSSVAASSTGNKITYLLTDNTGTKLSRYPVTVTLGGVAQSAPCAGFDVTNVDGECVFTYTAPATSQSLTIAATAGGTRVDSTVNVAGVVSIPNATLTPTSGSVSASPNVLSVNAVGSSVVNKAEIRALLLGANNQPVQNARVWFDLDGDKNSVGGTLESVTAGVLAYTDVNGIARTTYAPGSRFSPKDGVTIRACWDTKDFAIPASGGACPKDALGVANEARATLTVVSESLSVSIGTSNNLVTAANSETSYAQQFVVQVVDSAGKAMAGVKVSPSLDLLAYYKGEYQVVGTSWVIGGRGNSYPSTYASGRAVPYGVPADASETQWTPLSDSHPYAVTQCYNEDLNRNGVSESFLDAFEGVSIPEDQNLSGAVIPVRQILEPRKADVAVAVVGSDTTDANGSVILKIEYPKNLGGWVAYNLLVSASGVAGTEGRASHQARLLVDAAALTKTTVDPPFRYSPYGTLGSPTYLRMNSQGQFGWLCTNPN